MKIPCPNCAKTLALADHLAGKRVKCPSCQEIFRVPQAADAAPAPAAKAAAAPRPAAAPPPAAVQKTAPVQKSAPARAPSKPARTPCPECGESLATNGRECPTCGWTAAPKGVQATKPASKPTAKPTPPRDDSGGRCYIDIRGDEVKLTAAVVKRMKKLIDTEQLELQIVDTEEQVPDELAPDDLLISGKVIESEYGSRFMRYWLTFITMLGPGSCRLAVAADIETGEGGHRTVKSRDRQWFGFFGGAGPALMKRNVQLVSTRIANDAARAMTGNSFLNIHAYQCAYWSLGLGIAALIPFIGSLFGLIALIVGLMALKTINKRKLPRGKGAALTGILLALVGFLVTGGAVVFFMQHDGMLNL